VTSSSERRLPPVTSSNGPRSLWTAEEPGVHVIKLYLSVINEFLYKARVFVRPGWKSLPGASFF
jgi:hypothetical protein